jgi:hypothetical protein
MEHLADEFDCGWFIRVLFLEMHNKPEGSIFEGRICWSDDDGVPVDEGLADDVIQDSPRVGFLTMS